MRAGADAFGALASTRVRGRDARLDLSLSLSLSIYIYIYICIVCLSLSIYLYCTSVGLSLTLSLFAGTDARGALASTRLRGRDARLDCAGRHALVIRALRLLRLRGIFFFFFTLFASPRRSVSLKLCDTRVFEPQIRGMSLITTGISNTLY